MSGGNSDIYYIQQCTNNAGQMGDCGSDGHNIEIKDPQKGLYMRLSSHLANKDKYTWTAEDKVHQAYYDDFVNKANHHADDYNAWQGALWAVEVGEAALLTCVATLIGCIAAVAAVALLTALAIDANNKQLESLNKANDAFNMVADTQYEHDAQNT